jgi:CRISPR-associated protein (TIGR03986 family)
VLKEGAVFTFSVDFENLASEELGALLWALELEQDMHHRLGYGKPLGFGSVKINVDQLELLRPQERYAALIQSGWHPALDRKQDWIKQFKDEMHSLYTTPFEELTNVRDMHAVLSKPALEHIHYPRRNPIPDPDGKNFEWFMQNKHQTLGVAEADAGLKPS